MWRRFASVTGFVLVGGASRRMGEDKARLVLAGETMLERQIRLLRTVCRRVAVLGPPERFPALQVPAFPDQFKGRGPLAGIYTGLRNTGTELNLFLGCDLPFMEVEFLYYLCWRARERRADVTVPESRRGKLEPLVAVYRRRALKAVGRCLEAGEDKVSSFYSRVRLVVISWPEIKRVGFDPEIFVNMNTRQDYKEALAKLSNTEAPSPSSTATGQLTTGHGRYTA